MTTSVAPDMDESGRMKDANTTMSSNKRLAVDAGTIHLVLMDSFQTQKPIENCADVAVNQ